MRDDVQGLQYSCNCVLGVINAQIMSKGDCGATLLSGLEEVPLLLRKGGTTTQLNSPLFLCAKEKESVLSRFLTASEVSPGSLRTSCIICCKSTAGPETNHQVG